jgi:hypothetical protein
MKTKLWPALLVMVGLVVGYLVGGTEKTAQGQAAPPGPGAAPIPLPFPRFMIQAWAYGQHPQGAYGCYVVDTGTGELWHAIGTHPPVKLANELPKQPPKGRAIIEVIPEK